MTYDCKSTNDIVTPGFRKRAARGEWIQNPFSTLESNVFGTASLDYLIQTHSLIDGIWVLSGQTEVQSPDAHPCFRLGNYVACADSESSFGQLLARTKYSDAVASEQLLLSRVGAKVASPDALALVTLAEAEKTVDLGVTLLRRLAYVTNWLSQKGRFEMLKGIRYQDLRSLARQRSFSKRALILAAGEWLQFRYGIMSTYYDFVSFTRAASHTGGKLKLRQVANTSTHYDSGVIKNHLESGVFADEYTENRYTRSTSSSAGVIIRVDGSDATLTPNKSFGVSRILSTAWEIIPYSFVVDWAIDAGQRIAAFEGMWLYPDRTCWLTHYSRFTKTSQYYEVGKTTISGSTRYSASRMSDTALIQESVKYVERKANPSLAPIPSIRVKLNTTRLVDAVALLVQQSRKLRLR